MRFTLTPLNIQIDQCRYPLSISPVDADASRHAIFLQRIDRGEVLAQNNQRAPAQAHPQLSGGELDRACSWIEGESQRALTKTNGGVGGGSFIDQQSDRSTRLVDETSEVFTDGLASPVNRSDRSSGRACWTMKTSEVFARAPVRGSITNLIAP
jgi:hypothetical protein